MAIQELLQQEVFWVGSSTVAFLLLLAKPVGRFINNALDDRQARIQKELDEAKRLREEAQTLLESYEQKQQDALKEAEEIVKHAKEQASAYLQRSREELAQALEKRKQIAENKISQLETGALEAIQKDALKQAIQNARTVINIKQDSINNQAFDTALGELESLLEKAPPTS